MQIKLLPLALLLLITITGCQSNFISNLKPSNGISIGAVHVYYKDNDFEGGVDTSIKAEVNKYSTSDNVEVIVFETEDKKHKSGYKYDASFYIFCAENDSDTITYYLTRTFESGRKYMGNEKWEITNTIKAHKLFDVEIKGGKIKDFGSYEMFIDFETGSYKYSHTKVINVNDSFPEKGANSEATKKLMEKYPNITTLYKFTN